MNTRPDAQWSAYRAEVMAEQQAGKLTASEAQRRLRDGWVNIYGDDPTMTGFYAYSETLLRSAEQGRIPLDEAQALIKAREKIAVAEYQAIQRRRQEVAGPDYDRW
jgi:hypothetical protein